MQVTTLNMYGRMEDMRFNISIIVRILIALFIFLLPSIYTNNFFFKNTSAIGDFYVIEYLSRFISSIIALVYLDLRIISKISHNDNLN